MSRLRPTIAVADYDRTRPLLDGRVDVEGCDPIWLSQMPIETMFSRALGHAEFDVSELSFSNFLKQTAAGECAYVGLPIFPSRSFRHGAWFVRDGGDVREPGDLAGRRVGVREYSMTAAVVGRGIMADEFGVSAQDVTWVIGDVDEHERDVMPIPSLGTGFKVEQAPSGRFLADMLDDGNIDALLAYKPPKRFGKSGRIRRLFADHVAHEKAYAARTKIFPIMHLIGLRRELAEAQPWLAQSLVRAFSRAKDLAFDDLSIVQALKISLPWMTQAFEETTEILGRDYWPYGAHANAASIAALARWHHEQGLSPRQLTVEDMFFRTTLT